MGVSSLRDSVQVEQELQLTENLAHARAHNGDAHRSVGRILFEAQAWTWCSEGPEAEEIKARPKAG